MSEVDKQNLNRQLAIALGWTVRKTGYDGWNRYRRGSEVFELCDPQGSVEIVYLEQEETSESQWATEEEAWALAPDFTDSCDATLATLPDDLRVDIQFFERSDDRAAFYRVWLETVNMDKLQFGEGATRAEALAAARLAMAQAEAKQHGD